MQGRAHHLLKCDLEGALEAQGDCRRGIKTILTKLEVYYSPAEEELRLRVSFHPLQAEASVHAYTAHLSRFAPFVGLWHSTSACWGLHPHTSAITLIFKPSPIEHSLLYSSFKIISTSINTVHLSKPYLHLSKYTHTHLLKQQHFTIYYVLSHSLCHFIIPDHLNVMLFVAEAPIFSVCTVLEVTLSIFSSYSLVRLIFPCRGRKNTPSLNSSSAVPLCFKGPF